MITKQHESDDSMVDNINYSRSIYSSASPTTIMMEDRRGIKSPLQQLQRRQHHLPHQSSALLASLAAQQTGSITTAAPRASAPVLLSSSSSHHSMTTRTTNVQDDAEQQQLEEEATSRRDAVIQLQQKESVIKKPFFIMDWLEQVGAEELELARSMLSNKTKKIPTTAAISTRQQQPTQEQPSSTTTHNYDSVIEPQQHQQQPHHVLSKSTSSDSFLIGETFELPKQREEQQQPPDEQQSALQWKVPMSSSSPLSTISSDCSTMQKSVSNTNNFFFQKSVAAGTRYNAKGIVCATRGEWEKALQYWEDALEIRTQIYDSTSSLDVANTFNNIGIALMKLQRYDEALQALQSALNIRSEQYGWFHESIAATLHNIGNVHQQQSLDTLGYALDCFYEAAQILTIVYGTMYHEEVARAIVAIGHTYSIANALHDARQAYVDAYTIFQAIGFVHDDSNNNNDSTDTCDSLHHPEVQAILDDITLIDERIG